MSYQVYLRTRKRDPKSVVRASNRPDKDPLWRALTGNDEAEISITWNYARHFGFRELHGLTGEQSLPVLIKAVFTLGTLQTSDCFLQTSDTRGNVGAVCLMLYSWAKEHPKARWVVH